MKCFMTHQDCIYEKDIQKSLNSKSEKSLFVISPFGYPYNEIFQNIIAPAGEKAGIEVRRADVAFQLGFVMCTKVCKPMRQATYVVADLTVDNPNAFYELGLAWGFGKKIVILRDMDVHRSDCFQEILGTLEQGILSYEEPGTARAQASKNESTRLTKPAEGRAINVQSDGGKNRKQRILCYEELLEIREQLSRKEPTKLVKFLEDKAIDVEDAYGMKRYRAPGAYIEKKHISVCHRAGRPDAKFYLGVAQEAIKEVADNGTKKKGSENKKSRSQGAPENSISPELWELESVPIGGENRAEPLPKTSEMLAKSLPERLAPSKVVIVDVTHYDDKPDPSTYFALGLSHAMGRGTIPITNRARCEDNLPFDVRGLWQVYFESLQQLKTGLVGILRHVVSPEYDRERGDYPLRFIWDEVFSRNPGLTVITCARGDTRETDRAGGRTHVDKWDYASVANLANSLGKVYRQAEIDIRPPEEKAKVAPSRAETAKSMSADEKVKKLREEKDNLIIVGSPDVNDYAEIVLAQIYGVPAYQREPCKRSEADPLRERCWKCKGVDNSQCLGQRGYLYYKETIEKEHARKMSHFFRDPPGNEGDCVLWYGERLGCTPDNTFGVLTLFEDRKEFFARDDEVKRWIILLSGFTGVSTYVLAQVLTTPKAPLKQGSMLLQEALERTGYDLKQGVQVLVSVDYTIDAADQSSDRRKANGFRIRDIRPLRAGKGQPSVESPQKVAPVKPFFGLAGA